MRGREGEGGREREADSLPDKLAIVLSCACRADGWRGTATPRRLLTPRYLDLRGVALVLDNLNTLVR